MKPYALSTLAHVLDAQLIGADTVIDAVSIDTRSACTNALFIAIKGAQFDGHNFLEAAAQAGAAACLVSEVQTTALPQLVVKDTQRALAQLATYHRQQFTFPIAVLTGSYGKTTVKEMLRACASVSHTPCLNLGNFNNEIGLPLSLLQLDDTHDMGIFEIGTNHRGEIARLTEIAQPDIGIVLSVGEVHSEGIGPLETIAQEKSDLYRGLKPGASAVINCDIQFAQDWLEEFKTLQCTTLSLKGPADITAHTIKQASDGTVTFTVSTPQGDAPITLSAPGMHQVSNALCATALSLALGITLEDSVIGLQQFSGVQGRLQRVRGIHEGDIIDDTYNANLDASIAALKFLVTQPKPHVFITGDFAECGDAAERLHCALGQHAHALGIDALYAVGTHSAETVRAFEKPGHFFTTHDALIEAVRNNLPQGGTILVKGSRSMKMERVVEALKKQDT